MNMKSTVLDVHEYEKSTVQGVYGWGGSQYRVFTNVEGHQYGVFINMKRENCRVFINVKGGHCRVFMNVRSIPEETVALRYQAITRYLHRRPEEKSALSTFNPRWELVLVPLEDKKKEIITTNQCHHSTILA